MEADGVRRAAYKEHHMLLQHMMLFICRKIGRLS